MTHSLFSDDFKAQPYWWDRAPRKIYENKSLPKSVDVLVIGSGYTGLSAALQTARGGRSTLVVDSQVAGWGCSSRNGGQVSNSLKPDYQKLSKRVGQETARGVLKEGLNALKYLDQFIHEEGVDCDWHRCGRFMGAHNKFQFEQLRNKASKGGNDLELPFEIISPHQTRSEIGTDFYHGGCVYPDVGALHPGKYSSELLRLCVAAGVEIRSNCEITHIDKRANGFTLTSPLGQIEACDVIVATNGYTDKLFPGLKRRVIPIGSYMLATEILSPELMQELLPTRRMITDTRKLVCYYRACPEGKRILYGGRVASGETDSVKSAPKLHQAMCEIFPQLQATKISHSWMGFVAYTFDEMPHIGKLNGLYYSMGYCGSGVSLSSYFGMKIGRQVLGDEQGETPLSNINFQTRPYYNGQPWFLKPSIMYYRLRDRIPF